MGSMTIWSVMERKARFGIKTTVERLNILKEKRIRQLVNLIEKQKGNSVKRVNRLKIRLAYLGYKKKGDE